VVPKLQHLKFLSCKWLPEVTSDGNLNGTTPATIMAALRCNQSLLDADVGTLSLADQLLLRAYLHRNRNLQAQVFAATKALVKREGGDASLLPSLFKVEITAGQGPQQASAALGSLDDYVGPFSTC
jgi:hypothetical protein